MSLANAEHIIDRLTDHAADLAETISAAEPKWAPRAREILLHPEERDEDLWFDGIMSADLEDVTIDLKPTDLEIVLPSQRDATWRDTMALLVDTSWKQAAVELLIRDVLTLASESNADARAIRATDAEWHRAAKIGVSKRAVEERIKARRLAREAGE